MFLLFETTGEVLRLLLLQAYYSSMVYASIIRTDVYLYNRSSLQDEYPSSWHLITPFLTSFHSIGHLQ